MLTNSVGKETYFFQGIQNSEMNMLILVLETET